MSEVVCYDGLDLLLVFVGGLFGGGVGVIGFGMYLFKGSST